MILQKKHFYSSKSKTFITIWLVLLPLILTLNIKKTQKKSRPHNEIRTVFLYNHSIL